MPIALPLKIMSDVKKGKLATFLIRWKLWVFFSSRPTPQSANETTKIVIGCVSGAVFLIMFALAVLFYCKRYRKPRSRETKQGILYHKYSQMLY